MSESISERMEQDSPPGLTIGVSGPRRRGPAQRLITLALRMQGARTHYIRPGAQVNVSLLDGLVLSGGTSCRPSKIPVASG